MAPFFSNPNVLFFLSRGLGRGQRTPTEVTKPTLMEQLHTTITPERSAQKPRNVWGCLEEGSPPQAPGAKKERDGEEETSPFHSCQEALTQLPFTERQKCTCSQPQGKTD